MGRKQGKAGPGVKNQRWNGLVWAGLSDSGSVAVDFGDDALYASYTHHFQHSVIEETHF
jgi:hypothetical protein